MSREFYQTQLAQAGNATAAIAVAQNLSTTFAMIKGGPLDRDMYQAGPWVVLPIILAAMAIYVAVVDRAHRTEVKLADCDPDNNDKSLAPAMLWLCRGRIICIAASAIPLTWVAYCTSTSIAP